jgi:hypothetical protein
MKKMIVGIVGIVALGIGAASAEIDPRNVWLHAIDLDGDATDTILRCPWGKKLSIMASKEAPAAVVKCIDGGPGIEFGYRDPNATAVRKIPPPS